MKEIHVKNAQIEDAEEILAIYRPYVLNTAISFEIEVPSVEEMAQRIINYSSNYPFLVATIDKQIVGYAYSVPFSPRKAYEYSCEMSLYIDESAQGLGVGSQLYQKMEEILKKRGIVQLISCITASNTNSLLFFERRGFTKAGQIPNIGYKFDQWHDVVWMMKTINPARLEN